MTDSILGVSDLIAAAAGETCADGYRRIAVTEVEWQALARGCAEGRHDLLALWVDGKRVRIALRDPGTSLRAIVSLDCAGDRYPAIGCFHAPAIRLERAMRDLYGCVPDGLADDRPWLDHGVGPAFGNSSAQGQFYRFLPAEGEGLHQIPVGPVHAGIIEPGHFRFTANGETIVRLEQRFGYTHKGVEALLAGGAIDKAARLAARISGDSTVAYSFAFARAVESICGVEIPQRARLLRGIMAELERISHHISDFGAICNDASVVTINAHCALLRERLLQMADRCFGHRLMMDRIVPGGVVRDLADDDARALRHLLEETAASFANTVRVYDESPSLLDRTVSTGIVTKDLARRFAAGGFVGRASGRDFDSRRDAAYTPYDSLSFTVPTRQRGDVDARAWIRAEETAASIDMILHMLDRLVPGPIRAGSLTPQPGEAAALVEAFRGDVFVTVRLDEQGEVAHCHARDPSWFQWPLLEAAIEGNIVADFPLCNKSFNCSYSGPDL